MIVAGRHAFVPLKNVGSTRWSFALILTYTVATLCALLSRRCRCRPSAYLNNVLEQDHRFLKRRMAASLWFRSVEGALRTIAGYEAMNMIRKGQIRWLAKGDIAGQVNYIEQIFGIAA